MEHKVMRSILREAGIHVPRSNEDLEAAYKAYVEKTYKQGPHTAEKVAGEALNKAEDKVIKLVSTNIWTYVGAGETPPHMIDFMGLEKFIRGQAKEVTNKEVLEKIKIHPCFVKGTVDQDTLFNMDEEARKKADEQRFEDLKTQIEVERKNA